MKVAEGKDWKQNPYIKYALIIAIIISTVYLIGVFSQLKSYNSNLVGDYSGNLGFNKDGTGTYYFDVTFDGEESLEGEIDINGTIESFTSVYFTVRGESQLEVSFEITFNSTLSIIFNGLISTDYNIIQGDIDVYWDTLEYTGEFYLAKI